MCKGHQVYVSWGRYRDKVDLSGAYAAKVHPLHRLEGIEGGVKQKKSPFKWLGKYIVEGKDDLPRQAWTRRTERVANEITNNWIFILMRNKFK